MGEMHSTENARYSVNGGPAVTFETINQFFSDGESVQSRVYGGEMIVTESFLFPNKQIVWIRVSKGTHLTTSISKEPSPECWRYDN